MALPYNPLVKPRKLTPEERRAERRDRESNPLKPTFAKKEKAPGLSARSPLKRRTPLGVGKGTLKRTKPGLRRPGKRKGQTFWVSSAGAAWSARKRKPLRLLSLSENAKERRRLDAAWVERVWAVWGSCIITGAVKGGFWPVDAHHCFDKSIRPQWRHDLANGILLRRDIHGMVDNDPDLHRACQEVADECRAAHDGRRPPVSRLEAREVIFRMAPKMRKYANPEED